MKSAANLKQRVQRLNFVRLVSVSVMLMLGVVASLEICDWVWESISSPEENRFYSKKKGDWVRRKGTPVDVFIHYLISLGVVVNSIVFHISR